MWFHAFIAMNEMAKDKSTGVTIAGYKVLVSVKCEQGGTVYFKQKSIKEVFKGKRNLTKGKKIFYPVSVITERIGLGDFN